MLNAPANPDPDAIARAIARAHGLTILPEGNTALNLLGLSTQVPAQWQYFSDDPTKSIHWSGGVIAFKHRANKETIGLSPETALLVQALKTLSKDHVDGTVLCTLRERISEKAFARAARQARYATSWVYEIIKRLAENKEAAHA